MIAVECPRCGAATPAFPLAPEHVACRACHYQGPPRPEVVAQLRNAAGHLGVANAYLARQIGGAQARAIASLTRIRAWLHTVLVVLIVPLGGCGGCLSYVAVADDDPDYFIALLFGLPLVCFMVAVVLASRRIDGQMRELTQACGAFPPPAPGEPAQCHLCGVGLPPATSANPIVRCRHCGADNVASPAALKLAVNRKHWVVGHFSRALERRSEVMSTSGAGLVAAVFAFGLVSPIVGCTGAIVTKTLLDTAPLEVLPIEYVVVDVGGEACVAQVVEPLPAGGGWSVRGAVSFGGPSLQEVPPSIQRVPVTWLEGRWTRANLAPTSERGFVRDTQRHLLRPKRNELVLEREDGSVTRGPVVGRCLLERPPGALFAWQLTPKAPAGPATPPRR